MKRMIIGMALLLALTNVIYAETAPEEAWSKTFGGTRMDVARSVQQTSAGGYILTGYTKSYGAGDDDFWLVKTDSEGNKEWDKTFGGTCRDRAYSIQQTSDGGYILAGHTGSYGAGDDDFWLVKTDSEGNKKWDKTFGGTSEDRAYSIQQTFDGGYIFAGHTESYGAGDCDFWLVKTDSEGNKEWDKTFGGTRRDSAYSIQQTSDGGYILAGHTESYGAGYRDLWLVKTDSEGKKEWDKTFGGTSEDRASSVEQTSDGGYILAGSTWSYNASFDDFWFVKTDSKGNKEWDKIFWGPSNDGASSVKQTSDGGYILAGGNGFRIIKTDSEGNKEWNKTFGEPNNAAALSVQLTSDGGYIFAGRMGFDFCLMKLGGEYIGGETPTLMTTPTETPTTTSTSTPPSVTTTSTPTATAIPHPTFIHTPIQIPKDTSPPAISILNPTIIEYNNNGVIEEGEKVKITYGAMDPGGVASIRILLDGAMLESRNQAGTYTVTTNSLSVGRHTIRVEAADSKSNSCFEELPLTVERTGPSVYFGTTRTSIKKGEDAIFTLSAVNPIGNPPMTVQLILKPPSGVSVTSSSFAKAGSGIYTCTQAIESGDNVRSIEVRLTGNQVGTHEIISEVYYLFEGSSRSPTQYDTLTLIVEPEPTATTLNPGEREKRLPGFTVVAVAGVLLVALLIKRRRLQ